MSASASRRPPPADAAATPNAPPHAGLAGLTLAALGVVYGDIGTSPLYTVKEVFLPATGVALNADNLVGAVSAIVWALMLVVTLKYVVLILRADNHGEGGGLALTALAAQAVAGRPALRQGLLLLAKRLERGRFIWPQASDGRVVLTPAQLSMLLEGIDWRMPVRTHVPELAA